MDKGIVKIKDLSYSYPDGTKALSDMNLEVLKGETVGIVGPNAAGKTTLLLHLNGILRGEGSIEVAGLCMGDKNLLEIRKRIGLVFQDPDDQLFTPSVYDDIAFGLLQRNFEKEKIDKLVEDALLQVGMCGFEKKCSHHLSFGQKKKVSLATVLALPCEVLVLDEPSSNLDPKSRREFIDILKNLAYTKLIATHDLELVLEVCQRVVILDGGKIVADGKTLQILSNEPLLTEHNLEVPSSLKKQTSFINSNKQNK